MRNREGQDRKSMNAHARGPPGYIFELSGTGQEHSWIDFGIQESAA